MSTILRLPALVDRLRAHYPLLAVIAVDEHDGVEQVQLACGLAGVACELVGDEGRGPVLGAATPLGPGLSLVQALQAAVDAGRPQVLVATGLGSLTALPLVVRAVTQRLVACERAGVSLVLVGPTVPQVPDWSRDLVTLTLPLPARPELEPLARAALGQAQPAELDAAIQTLQGLTLAQARRALRRVRSLPMPQVLGELRAEKRDLLASSGVVEVVATVPELAEVGGLDELKAWLLRQKMAMGQAARDFGVPVPRGVLLVGVQGCGKTLTAKAASAVLGLPLLRLDLGRLYTADRVPDENLRHALQVAEAMAPVVLWIDELDKAFGGVGSSEEGARVFGSLLTWLGEGRSGVFVAATANRLTHLPAELLRKGRFDETFFVDVPDQAARTEILSVALRRSGRDPQTFDLERLAKASDRLTGAEIEQAVAEALQVAFCAGRELTIADLEAVLAKVVPFVETYDVQVRELRQWAKRHCRPAARDRSLHELFAAARQTTGARDR